MDRVNIYEYDQKNRESIFSKIEETRGEIVGIPSFAALIKQCQNEVLHNISAIYLDLSPLFYNEDRADALVAAVEPLLVALPKESIPILVILDRRYGCRAKSLLYYKIDEIISLERVLKINIDTVSNIVDIAQDQFELVLDHLSKNLFGNARFKIRLKEELLKYRVFNRIGQQPIFSLLICGASGIGKTEVARLLHRELAPDEPMIKINFGNYSAQDALNSLIGSPRGYIGSNKGELPDKLMRSRSKVILIDEFEKASKPVYNFFLQMLEEGKFTDSLGREYDLNKYIIVFTSNMAKDKIGEYLPPELRSRFSYKCAFGPLTEEEKKAYVEFKGKQYLEQIKNVCPQVDKTLEVSDVVSIDVQRYSNMRDINSEIMRQITNTLYDKII